MMPTNDILRSRCDDCSAASAAVRQGRGERPQPVSTCCSMVEEAVARRWLSIDGPARFSGRPVLSPGRVQVRRGHQRRLGRLHGGACRRERGDQVLQTGGEAPGWLRRDDMPLHSWGQRAAISSHAASMRSMRRCCAVGAQCTVFRNTSIERHNCGTIRRFFGPCNVSHW